MKSNCHKLLFIMTYAKRFCEHFETQAVQHLLFTLKANLDIDNVESTRLEDDDTVFGPAPEPPASAAEVVFFFRISYINV